LFLLSFRLFLSPWRKNFEIHRHNSSNYNRRKWFNETDS
jgi:hypothetical protein